MSKKYSGIDNINKPAFDAIVPKVKEMIEKGEVTGSNGVVVKNYEGSYNELSHEFLITVKLGDVIQCSDDYRGIVITCASRKICVLFIADDDSSIIFTYYQRPNIGPKKWIYNTESAININALISDLEKTGKSLVFDEYGSINLADGTIIYKDNGVDWESLTSSTLSKVKVGDIIYCNDEESISIVDFVSEDDIAIFVPYNNHYYTYSWSSQEEAWLFDTSVDRTAIEVNEGIQNGFISVGTKLYVHHIECSCLAPDNTPISFNLKLITSYGDTLVGHTVEELFNVEMGTSAFNSNKVVSIKFVAQGDPDKLCCFSGASTESQLIVFDAMVSGNITVKSFLNNSTTQHLENSIINDVIEAL